MKLFRTLLKKEIHDLFTLPAAGFIYLIISIIVGYSYKAAVQLYSNASISALQDPLYAAGFEPIKGIFVPSFGGVFIAVSLFVPFLFIHYITQEKRNNTFPLLLQVPYSYFQIITAKIIAAVLYYLSLLLFMIPALLHWQIIGGHTAMGELLLLFCGYVLYGVSIIAICFLSGNIFNDGARASIIALLLIIVSWLIDFGSEVNISPVVVFLSHWTLTAMLKTFENSIVSTAAVSYFILISAALFGGAYYVIRTDRKKFKKTIIISIVLLAVLFAVSQSVVYTRDISESRRNSFSPHVEKVLRKLDSLRITIYMAGNDSRYKYYKHEFLDPLKLINRNCVITIIEDNPEKYGLFEYSADGTVQSTYSSSIEEVIRILFELAHVSDTPQEQMQAFQGWPLTATKQQSTVIVLFYYLLLPLILGGIYILMLFGGKNKYNKEIEKSRVLL